MKKKLCLCMVALLSCTLFATAGDTEGNGVYPYEHGECTNENATTAISNLSLYFPFGFTFADMDETGGAKLGSGISDMTMNLGLGLEWNFTPTWGLAGEFSTTNYGIHSFKATKQDDGTRVNGYSFGNIYNMGLFLTYDFADAFFPNRHNALFNVYGLIGLGMGIYTYQSSVDSAFSSTKQGKNYNYDPYLGFGGLADFNITRSFSLGLRLMYYYYMSDNLDYSAVNGSAADDAGRINSNNDGLITCDLVLRYNINAKAKSHMRNLPSGVLKDWEKTPYKKEEQKPYVPQKDTLVISHKDTLVMKSETKTEVTSPSDMYFVYFDNDKYNLNERAKIDVQEMAFRLQRNPDSYVELSGFCDNTGSDAHNEELAKKRAKTVRDQLINVYGISPDRLIDLGKGKLTNVKDSYGPNRRVDMRFVEKSEFDQIKSEKEQKASATTDTDTKKAAVKELPDTKQEVEKEQPAAVTENVETAQEALKSQAELLSEVEIYYDTTKYIGVEIATQSSTLSKYARKYYGNTNCWAYIYQANKEVIKSPSYIWPNAKIYMPKLTEEEKQITAEEAAALAKKVK